MKNTALDQSKLNSSGLVALTAGLLALMFASSVSGQGLGFQGDLIAMSDGSRTAQVYAVSSGGIARRLGVRPGDTILGVNGYWPGNAEWNQRAIRAGRGTVSIVVKRDGRTITLGGNRVPRSSPQRNGQSVLRKKLVGYWWSSTDDELVRVFLSANGNLHVQAYNQYTKEPISGMSKTGRWKLSGETLVYFLDGQLTSCEIIAANSHEIDIVNLKTNESYTWCKNWAW